MRNKRLVMLMEIAIFGALGFVLDRLLVFEMPQGGSITLVMLPILLMAFRRGVWAGLLTGFIVGLLQLITGNFYAAPLSFGFVILQVGLDYVIAFIVIGFAGIFRTQFLQAKEKDHKKGMVIAVVSGAFIGSFLRYIVHVITGIFFFGEFAGEQNVVLYSLIYNSTYMIPVFLLGAIVCSILFMTAPRLLQPNN